jgi:hypothetical protein
LREEEREETHEDEGIGRHLGVDEKVGTMHEGRPR